jgi:hypothetical protein
LTDFALRVYIFGEVWNTSVNKGLVGQSYPNVNPTKGGVFQLEDCAHAQFVELE